LGVMPLKKFVISSFKSESEEAAWWENNRAAVEADLRAAMRENKTLSLQGVMVQVKQKKEASRQTRRSRR
jgi:hypothetical protein